MQDSYDSFSDDESYAFTDGSSLNTGKSSMGTYHSGVSSVAQAGAHTYTFCCGFRKIQLHIPGGRGTFRLDCKMYYQDPKLYPDAIPIANATFSATAFTWSEIEHKTLDWARSLGILSRSMQEWIRGCQPA